MKDLTPKQKRFCDEYLVDYNATQAAIRAGYLKSSATSQASRLLTNANVSAYIASKVKRVEQKLEISAERTLLELARVAYTPATAFYDENGNLIPVHKLGADAAACVSGIEIEEIKEEGAVVGTLRKIKRFDKNSALTNLAKHFKLFVDTPPPPININLGTLSADDLKNLLAIKKKMSG